MSQAASSPDLGELPLELVELFYDVAARLESIPIERAAGVKFNELAWTMLVELVGGFLYFCATPRMSKADRDVRSTLFRRLGRQTAALARTLRELQALSVQNPFPFFAEYFLHIPREKVRMMAADDLDRFAEQFSRVTKRPRGRPREQGLRFLIRECFRIYRGAGGHGTAWRDDINGGYQGGLLNMIEAILSAVGVRYESRSALAEFIIDMHLRTETKQNT
jgi:hypothetical protein